MTNGHEFLHKRNVTRTDIMLLIPIYCLSYSLNNSLYRNRLRCLLLVPFVTIYKLQTPPLMIQELCQEFAHNLVHIYLLCDRQGVLSLKCVSHMSHLVTLLLQRFVKCWVRTAIFSPPALTQLVFQYIIFAHLFYRFSFFPVNWKT